jgi:hypothetical protein
MDDAKFALFVNKNARIVQNIFRTKSCAENQIKCYVLFITSGKCPTIFRTTKKNMPNP